jgi:hypothetical protein
MACAPRLQYRLFMPGEVDAVVAMSQPDAARSAPCQIRASVVGPVQEIDLPAAHHGGRVEGVLFFPADFRAANGAREDGIRCRLQDRLVVLDKRAKSGCSSDTTT